MIFYCSRPLRIFSRLPSKLAPTTALQAPGLEACRGPQAVAWPAKSPDMSCLDFWFWGVAMEEVRKSRPSTLNELKAVVDAFAESVNQGMVKRSARSTWKRARACKAVAGASFEGSLEKILRGLEQ